MRVLHTISGIWEHTGGPAESVPKLCAGLARGVLLPGDAALHVLVLGVPVAVLLPARAVFFRGSTVLQCVAAAFLAVSTPKIAALLGRVTDQAPTALSVTIADVIWAALLVPPATWLLRRLPPLAQFQETSE